ncbi:hypothetical protein [Streptomyces sp. NPDC058953]|uniref:hypothetical protein n=1 Tax=unclassified Streptomyces TaxID=2593676 RepID=UPI003679D9EE
MITEPELVGGDEPEGPRAWRAGPGERIPDEDRDRAEWSASDDGDGDGDGDGDKGGRRRPPPKAWVWALGGALLSSVLWAGGLYAYSAATDGDPDTGPYRAVKDLCEIATMEQITKAFGAFDMKDDQEFPHPAMHQASCSLSSGNGEEESDTSHLAVNVMIDYRLHKKTDPGPEFDALVTAEAGMMSREPERLKDLGERAYLVTDGEAYSVLHILDGQAVIRVQADSFMNSVEAVETPPEAVEHRNELIADVRTVLEKLRGGRD